MEDDEMTRVMINEEGRCSDELQVRSGERQGLLPFLKLSVRDTDVLYCEAYLVLPEGYDITFNGNTIFR